MTIIQCIVPEIWSMTDKIFCHFEPLFALFPYPKNPNNQTTNPNNPKNQNFQKILKQT